MVQLNIELEAELAAQEYNKACKRIGSSVSIPGFRKGKAPRSVIEKHVGADRIKHEALDRLLPNVFADAISEHQFDIAAEPAVESFDFEVGSPLNIVAKLELKPEFKLPEYKGLEIEVPEFKVEEDAIEKELKMLQDRFSTLEPVIDRPVGDTDVVLIDFDGTVEGEAIKGGSAKNYQLDIANSNFIKGFAEQIIGHSIGEEFPINVTFPEEYHDKNLSGKPAEFKIKINEIKEKKVPELTDELAQKVGPFQTIDALKSDIESYLGKSAEAENKNRTEKAILDKIIDSTEVEIPDSMTNREAKVLMEEVQGRMKSQGVSWEQVLESQGHENMWNNLREEASKRVKNSLVLGAIAKEEKLQVGEEDFREKVKELAAMYKTNEKEVYRQMSQNSGIAQALSQQIMGQKITSFLAESNTVKFVEDKSAKEEAAS